MVFFILESLTFFGPAFSLPLDCVFPRPTSAVPAEAPDALEPLSLANRCPIASARGFPLPCLSAEAAEGPPASPLSLPLPLAGLAESMRSNRSESIALACGLGFW